MLTPKTDGQYFVINIPVKAYIRKYFETKYAQPMILSVKNYFGTIVFAILDREKLDNHMNKNVHYVDYRFGKLTDCINVLILRRDEESEKKYELLSKLKAIVIDRLFQNKIAEDIHSICSAYKFVGMSQRKAIADFANMHNILLKSDMSYETIRKAEYRHKKKLKNSPCDFVPGFY